MTTCTGPTLSRAARSCSSDIPARRPGPAFSLVAAGAVDRTRESSQLADDERPQRLLRTRVVVVRRIAWVDALLPCRPVVPVGAVGVGTGLEGRHEHFTFRIRPVRSARFRVDRSPAFSDAR